MAPTGLVGTSFADPSSNFVAPRPAVSQPVGGNSTALRDGAGAKLSCLPVVVGQKGARYAT